MLDPVDPMVCVSASLLSQMCIRDRAGTRARAVSGSGRDGVSGVNMIYQIPGRSRKAAVWMGLILNLS